MLCQLRSLTMQPQRNVRRCCWATTPPEKRKFPCKRGHCSQDFTANEFWNGEFWIEGRPKLIEDFGISADGCNGARSIKVLNA
jgi:hypothetical protein